MKNRVGLRGTQLTVLIACASVVTAAEPPPAPPTEPLQQKDDELARKLLRKAQSGGDEDLMDSVMRLMDEATSNMEAKLDPGEKTQELHKQILDKLDEAIKAAATKRRPMRPPDSARQKDRRRTPDQVAQRGQGKTEKQARSSADDEAGARGAPVKPVELPDGELMDVRRAWGNLPQRDREEIIQGAGEEFLERYREWVERYYRALQESSSEGK